MSWMPVFKPGFLNAWILTLFVILHPFIMNLIDRAVGTGNINRKMGDVPSENKEKRSIPVPTILLIVIFLLSIFVPLKLGTAWFYSGLVIYLLGIGTFLSAMITAAKTPLGQVFSRGMYRYSRHPLYISFLLIFLGVSIASASWLYLILSMGWMIFPLSQVNNEENGCYETFGEQYLNYKKKTPKWLGIPKSKY